MTKKQRKCPQCQSKNVVEILYGMPGMEAEKEVDAGKYVLGGCCISDESSKWHCLGCEQEFGKYFSSVGLVLPVPEKLNFSIGSFSDFTYFVRRDNDTVQYGKSLGSSEYGEVIVSIAPSERKWKNFKKKLDDIDVWQWKKEYHNPNILDGAQWKLEIDYGDQKIKSYGSNLYPGALDLNCDVTPEFKALLHAFRLLLGGVKII